MTLGANRALVVGGLGAISGGTLKLLIAAAFALTGLGADGEQTFGCFSRLTFLPSAALVVAMLGLRQGFAGQLGFGGSGIVAAALGLTLITTGEFGGAWLDFARSGNYVIAPGIILVMAGLAAFAIDARRKGLPAAYANLSFLIALFPVAFFPVAAGIEALRGAPFPPALHDNYFRVLYVVTAFFWIALGSKLLLDSRGLRPLLPQPQRPLKASSGSVDQE